MRLGAALLLLLTVASEGVAEQAAAAASVVLRIQENISRGESKAAAALLRESLERWPREGGLYNLRGILHMQNGEPTAGKHDFETAVKLSPDLVPAWKNLARAEEPDSAPRAEAAYRRAVSLMPTDAEARIEYARLLLWRGAFSESMAQIAELPPAQHSNPMALALRCAAQAALGRNSEAASSAEDLSASSDLREDAVLAVLSVLELKSPQLALQLLEALKRRGAATQASLDHMGAIHENAGDLAGARADYEAVARAHGPTAATLLDLARVAYKQKDIEGALGYAAHARDVEPGNAAVHFFFGMLAVEKNLPIEARKSLEAAVRLAPAQPYYNYALGSVALQGRDPAEAIPYFQKFRALRPDDPRGRFALGVAYFNTGDLDRSRRELEAVKETPATKSGAQYFLGRIEKLNGKMDLAAAHLEQSIQANDAYPDAHAELGWILFRTSDLAGAAREIDRALQLDPENLGANRTRLILYQRTRDPRAEAQSVRVKEVEARRDREWNLLFRTIEVRPY